MANKGYVYRINYYFDKGDCFECPLGTTMCTDEEVFGQKVKALYYVCSLPETGPENCPLEEVELGDD